MNKGKTANKLLDKKQAFFGIVSTLAIALIALVGQLASTAVARADGTPGGNIVNPIVRAVDIAKPAVVRIITAQSGRLLVHFTATQNVTFPQGGGSYTWRYSGSGAFISAHGDVLTADHVVKPPHDQSLNQDLYTVAAQDIADYINLHFQTNVTYTKDDVLTVLQSGNLASTPSYDNPSSEAYLSTDFTGPINSTDLKNMPAGTHAPVDSIEKESTFDQKDVAIIHVNMNDMPSIQLGNSSNVAQQDELTIIGFPGNGDVTEKGDPTTLLTSSVNKIYVSALKQTDNGSHVIQVGGNVEHGDSGGPALDNTGHIVGVVSFGAGNSQPAGTSFLQSSNNAQDLIKLISLDTKPGKLQQMWNTAFADYTSTGADHWHKAQNSFKKLSNAYPAYHAIQPYITYIDGQASHEKLPAPAPAQLQINPVVIGGVTLAILAILALILLLIIQRKSRPGRQQHLTTIDSTLMRPMQNSASMAVLPTRGAISELAQPQSGWQHGQTPSHAQQTVGNNFAASSAPDWQPASTPGVSANSFSNWQQHPVQQSTPDQQQQRPAQMPFAQSTPDWQQRSAQQSAPDQQRPAQAPFAQSAPDWQARSAQQPLSNQQQQRPAQVPFAQSAPDWQQRPAQVPPVQQQQPAPPLPTSSWPQEAQYDSPLYVPPWPPVQQTPQTPQQKPAYNIPPRPAQPQYEQPIVRWPDSQPIRSVQPEAPGNKSEGVDIDTQKARAIKRAWADEATYKANLPEQSPGRPGPNGYNNFDNDKTVS